MEKYYVIHNGEGDTTVEELTKDELMERVNNDGSHYYGQPFLDEIPKDANTNYWGGSPLIIKGHVVSPKPIKIVEEFEIE